MKVVKALFFLMVLISSDAKAGLISTFELPNVNNSTSTDAFFLWAQINDIEGLIESFNLTLTWKDQGWGNQKSHIFYQLNDLQPIYIDTANHLLTTETFSIANLMAPAGSDLKLYYTVGGGGGHRMQISNASINITSVPEPQTIALFGLTLIGAALSRKKLRK